MAKRGKYLWAVRETKRHGVSVGAVRADNYKEAIRRAAEIGFKKPDSIALDDDGRIYRRWKETRKDYPK